MNLSEAYQTLGLNFGASKEDVKKTFKKLSVKYHPDVSKEPDANEKFKKITEAYHIIEDPSKASVSPYTSSYEQNFYDDFIDIEDLKKKVYDRIKNNFYSTTYNQYTTYYNSQKSKKTVLNTIEITFAESVLGCNKKVKYKKEEKCSCIPLTTNETCTKCKGSGYIVIDAEINVYIQPGIEDGMHVKVINADNYNTPSIIHVPIRVIPDSELSKRGENVFSTINISLLDAIKGCNKKVKTILGEMTLKIPEKIKHDTKIKVNGYGVGKRGAHIFTVNVQYPDDCSGLIEYLQSEKNKRK